MDMNQVFYRVNQMLDEISKQMPRDNTPPPEFIEWGSEAIIMFPSEVQGKPVNSWAIKATSTKPFTVAYLPNKEILSAQQNDKGEWVIVGAVSPGQVFVSANIQAITEFWAQAPVHDAKKYWSCYPNNK